MKKNRFLAALYQYRVAYVYIAPFFILFTIFNLFPMAYGFFLSFFRWDGLSAMHFNGLNNYINLFKDVLFWKALRNTLFIGIIAHIPILLGGLVLAYILNSKLVKGQNIFKTIYFMPMVTSSVAITIIFQNLFGFNYGLINWFLSLFGEAPINWLGGDGSLIKVAVIVMFAWKWVGWNMVIYLAGMQGISNDIYEAAAIDGANHTQIVFRILIFFALSSASSRTGVISMKRLRASASRQSGACYFVSVLICISPPCYEAIIQPDTVISYKKSVKQPGSVRLPEGLSQSCISSGSL